LYLLGAITTYTLPVITKLFSRATAIFGDPKGLSAAEKLVLYILKTKTDAPSYSKFTLSNKLLSHDDNLSVEDVAAECLDHLSAGLETTGDTLVFIIHLISRPKNAHIQEDLRSELIGHAKSLQNTEGLIGLDRLETLPYLNAVIKEGLRCYTPSSVSLPRLVRKGGDVVDGFWLPGGTVISAQAWTLHRLNQDVWESPNECKPGRWLRENSDEETRRRIE
jgi:cytochrome P450